MEKYICSELTESIISAAIEVHRNLGSGLLESAYEQCLCHELNLRGIKFQRQKPLPLRYKGINLDCSYRLDILVERQIVIELKTIEKILPVHKAQLLTYLKLLPARVGLILNFREARLKDGICRLVL
ncbi:MAG: GxxExxY protein [Thermodesulfobacteriota bacterium]|nr:GxxExxY protein [Thermodesulfobacteriota bacterium]